MLSNPRLALRLYVAILLVALMFSSKWGMLVGAIKTSKGSGSGSTNG